MIETIRRIPAELSFTAGLILLMLGLSVTLGLPISIPSGERAAFVGVHFLYPLIGVGIWGLFALFGLKRQLASTFLIALPCYALIIWVHFNIKLWIPFINPATYDVFFWFTDQMMRPLVDFCILASNWMTEVFHLPANFYMLGFMALFYVSFCFHAVKTPDKFRALFLSALIFQGLGALSYLPFPAIGPFLYEQGMQAASSGAQAGMLASHHAKLAGGAAWIANYGPTHITTGLAAMPSLHAGGAFLFFLFAWRYGRVLIPLYSVLLFYILVTAVATRWHYLIDLPVGMLLAWVSVQLGDYICARQTMAQPAADQKPVEPTAQPA